MRAEPLLSAVNCCRDRLEMIASRLRAADTLADVEGLAILADVELATTSLGATVGLERRDATIRHRAATASATRNPR